MGNFILFILTLFILAALLRIDFFFTILYLFVGVYILSHLWSQQILGRLHFRRRMVQRAFSGDTVTVRLELYNHSRLPAPWLLLRESIPTELSANPFRQVITLAGQARYSAEYSLTARKRGYYEVGPLSIQTGDILGIRQEQSGRFPADHLIVYPRVVPLSQLGLPTHSPQAILPTRLPLFPDPTRLTGVYDYTPGDNPRHIHWPATASTGQLLVKQFQPAIARDNTIFLNLGRDDYAKYGYPDTAIELAIITAASLANHLITFEKLPVGLVTHGIDPLAGAEQSFRLLPQKGRQQLMHILEVLARVQLLSNGHFLDQLRRETVHLPWGTTLIIITSHIAGPLPETLLFLKRSGFHPTLVLVNPPRSRMAGPGKMQILNVPTFYIQSERDIEAWTASS